MATMIATSVILFNEDPLPEVDAEADDAAIEEDGLFETVTICIVVWSVVEFESVLVDITAA